MTTPRFDFHALSPDLILDALADLGLTVDSGLTALNSYENRVYQFRLEDGQRAVIKFYRPERWNATQIQAEHDLAFYLAEEEVAVATPWRINGRSLHQHAGYLFAVWPSLGGRALEVDNLDQLAAVGHQLGAWHARVAGYALPVRGGFRPAERLQPALQRLLTTAPWPQALDGEMRQTLASLGEALQAPLSQPWHALALHGDCHPGNLLWRDGPLLVDLDDCCMGPAIQDLWMLLSGDHDEQRLQLDTLLEGYETFCDFDRRQLALIEPLRALRMVSWLAWIQQRWTDPAFPRAFPWFDSDSFWLQQIQLLQGQRRQLDMPALSLTPWG